IEAPVDPTKELPMLVYEHKYEEAFTYALQRVMFGSSPGYALRRFRRFAALNNAASADDEELFNGFREIVAPEKDPLIIANGMGKKNAKHPLMKSKAATSDKSCGSLWSISSNGKGSVYKVDPPVWNPNVIIPDET
ncbi:hypothetical protein Tco_0170078, partial [Tanacetum coccineum]